MKNFIIYIIACFVLFSCQSEEFIQEIPSSGRTSLRFSLKIPEYSTMTRAASYENTITNIELMVFDSKGLFLERVTASNLTNSDAGGSFDAEVTNQAGIIHVIANGDRWALYNDLDFLQKDEREIIPQIYGTTLMFWGRMVSPSFSAANTVTLYRNQAKVLVDNQADNFTFTGYALGNFVTSGTAAPFNPDVNATDPFDFTSYDKPTMPLGTITRTDQTAGECNTEAKYMFENPNSYSNQTYVIIKGKIDDGEELYYKIQLLDADKNPYPIVRNYNYRIVIESFSKDANGSASFNDAKMSEPSNNIYAEIFKESPTISDSENNTLTVGSTNYLFTSSGILDISAHYTENGSPSDAKILVSVSEDESGILSDVRYDSSTGKITGNVAAVFSGQSEATITVRAGILSREITIISSTLYDFTPAFFTPNVYQDIDEDVTLSFNIPETIPYYLYPLKCSITTKYLYPVEPNKNLEIEFSDGTYKYIYWANGPGTKNLYFKTSMHNSNETVTIENEYFNTALVDLISRQFENVSINGNNSVVYASGSPAELRFTIPDYPNLPDVYPLTVFVATNNLEIVSSGWTAVNGGYTYTYASHPSGEQTVEFKSKNSASAETITISAPGFSNATVSFDNTLASGVTVGNTIRMYYNSRTYTIPNASIRSSNTSVVPNFRVSGNSTYSFTIRAGSKLSDKVQLTYSNYGVSVTYTVEELLSSPAIILR